MLFRIQIFLSFFIIIFTSNQIIIYTNDIVDALNKEHYWINKHNMDQVQRDIVQALVTQYVFNELHQPAKLEQWTLHHGF